MNGVRRLAALTAAAAVAGTSLALGSLATGAGHAVAAAECTKSQSISLSTAPQAADTRLGFRSVWPITRGRGVRVAVLDSGYVGAAAGSYPNINGIQVTQPKNLVSPGKPLVDCANHGIGVTSLIAGQAAGTAFSGVAPDATIIPIKVQQGDVDANGALNVIAGIEYAVAVHARVANLSVGVAAGDTHLRQLFAAVQLARRHNLVLVCAAGNHQPGKPNTVTYPAAWSAQFPNVIAVTAVDAHDGATGFSDTGDYVDVAAPGSGVVTVNSVGGYVAHDGTSFAAPFVTGTVALMLSHDEQLTPAQVKAQLEATADPPPVATPSPIFGYGVINPYLAVTAPVGTAPATAPTVRAAALPPIPEPKAANHRLQHVALGVGGGLLGLAAVVAVGAAVLRTGRRQATPVRRRG